MRSTYLEGRPPKSVNMYWRRIAVSSIPLQTAEEFDEWTVAQWRLKDKLLETFVTTGRFPASSEIDIEGRSVRDSYIETSVRPSNWWEAGKIFLPLATYALVAKILADVYVSIRYGSLRTT